MVAAHFDLPLTFVECQACRFAKAVVAYRNIARLYFFCPSCEHTWNVPKPSTTLKAPGYDEVAARLERITYLCEAQGHLSRDSARFTVLADEIHRESAVYLALVDARRDVDHKQ
jgi:hypothetical protein